VKRELASFTLTHETSKKEWEGEVRNLIAADFTKTVWRWYER
jgi:hypothetical protein